MRLLSLCSGYGGLDYAVEAVLGAETVAYAEIDEKAASVFARHWPDVPNVGDLTAVDWTELEGIDVVTAGYPCQPFSHAGKRGGDTDERHLWPAVADAVRLLRPRVVVLENVSGHLSLGFGRVLGDLAEAGYCVRWTCVRAADVGAPHGRARVFIVATDAADVGHERAGSARVRRAGPADDGEPPTDTDGAGPQGRRRARVGRADERAAGADSVAAPADAADDQPQEPSGDVPVEQRGRARRRAPVESAGARAGSRGDDGASAARVSDMGGLRAGDRPTTATWGDYAPAIARWAAIIRRPAPHPTDERGRLSPLLVEWMMGLPAGWVTDTPGLSRADQLKILGNGVVPQQASAAISALLAARSEAA